MPETPQEVLALAEERSVQIVDLRFCEIGACRASPSRRRARPAPVIGLAPLPPPGSAVIGGGFRGYRSPCPPSGCRPTRQVPTGEHRRTGTALGAAG
jgi:hypothetical protein